MSFDIKALIRKKICQPGYEKLRETLGETLGEIPTKESSKTPLEFERNRQILNIEASPPVNWPKDLFKGVPDDVAVLFPSIRHDPDLRGFGVPSVTLPDDLQIFGYWGYQLRLARHTGNLQLMTTPRSSPCRHHVASWLNWRHDEVLEAFTQWKSQS